MEYINSLHTFVCGGVPSYSQSFHDIKWGAQYCWANCSGGDFLPQTFVETLKKSAVFDDFLAEIFAVLAGALSWSILRYVLTAIAFKPIARWFKLNAESAAKYPESQWKFFVYTFTLSMTIYTIFALPQYRHIFYEPDSLWKDYVEVQTGFPSHIPGMRVEPIVSFVYGLQISLYIHSIYASLYMDVWRKDSTLMVFHHFLTIALLGFSYIVRYYKIGLLVLLIHDPTDVILEFTKCNVYFKIRGGKFHKFHDVLSNIGFVFFAGFWYLLRLYWMPLKILHSTGYGTMIRHLQTHHLPFYFFFNGMLWMLQLLNLYWFLYIVYFMIKVATGQMDEVDDIRENEVADGRKTLRKQKGKGNGGQRGQSSRIKLKKAD